MSKRFQLWVGRQVLWLLRKLTNGRPMVYICPCFWDAINHRGVYLFRDEITGVYWMAYNRWSWPRVQCENPQTWIKVAQ